MNGKQYKLSILPLFEDDLDEIVDYITVRLRNPNAAERLVDDVEAAIRKRLEMPERFEPSIPPHGIGNTLMIPSRSGTSPYSMS